ncbi:MAG: hypothetical protein ACK4OE_15310 [Acidovorax sp.]|uniref:hypothetical protein n=1 Tax=Acidovorax sp. TaxID=1872122 RepID=UPI00391CB5F9
MSSTSSTKPGVQLKKMNPPNRWSAEDETYLRNAHGIFTNAAIAQKLGRTVTGIEAKVKRLMISTKDALGSTATSTSTATTKSTHLQRGRPAPIRSNGLHSIVPANTSVHGKVLISPVASQAELAARRKSERLELATSTMPVRNSTVRESDPYRCPELGRNPGIPDARFAAYHLPSRVGNRLHFPDGHIEEVPQP